MENNRITNMGFSKIYQLLLNKIERKGRTKAELDEVIKNLMGYTREDLKKLLNTDITYKEFFDNAPCMNEKRFSVKGCICKVRIEEIEDPLMRDIRILDKMVDELAKGKPLEKVLL